MTPPLNPLHEASRTLERVWEKEADGHVQRQNPTKEMYMHCTQSCGVSAQCTDIMQQQLEAHVEFVDMSNQLHSTVDSGQCRM